MMRTLTLRALLIIALLGVLPISVPARAQTNFSSRYTTNTAGDIAIISNTSMTCSTTTGATGASTCANARNAVGSALNNNSYTMVYVDVDGTTGSTTINSSQASWTLPTGGSVLWAGLYWGGVAASTVTARTQVKLRVPGASGYETIGGSGSFPSTLIGSGSHSPSQYYHVFANVTALVRAGGSGTYTVADIQSTPNATGTFAGWSLVVVYRDPQAPQRNLTVFDGLKIISTSAANVSIPVSGFQAPAEGPFNVVLGAVGYEGDRSSLGDDLKLNGTALTDANNPSGNFFNSTISRGGTTITTKNPNYVNQLGFDADMVLAPQGLVPNGATNATINLTTATSGGESYYPGVVTMSIEEFAPHMVANKSVADVNGGNVERGDVLEYTIPVANVGMDAASNVVLRDPIPAQTTYEPGSIAVTTGANTGTKTDTSGNDQGEYDAALKQVVVRLGTGASATSGGTLSANASTTVRFRVRVNADATGATAITNQASISYRSVTQGKSLANSSGVSSAVVSAPVLVATKRDELINDADDNGVPSPGDRLRYTITITNTGNKVATGVMFGDAIPSNTTYVAGSARLNGATVADGSGGTMPWASGASVKGASDTAGQISAGQVATVQFRVRIVSSLPMGVTQISNQGTVASAELASFVTDDPDTPTLADATNISLTAAPVLLADKTDALAFDLDGDGEASAGDVLSYEITVQNAGNTAATNVRFSDTPDNRTTLVASSVQTTQGTITGGSTGVPPIAVNLGTLAAGAGATISFRVTIDDNLPLGATTLSNQGSVQSNELATLVTNDPATSALNDATLTLVTAQATPTPTPTATSTPTPTRTPTATPGSLGITQPQAGDFTPVPLTGTRQTTTALLDGFIVQDSTNSGSGWHVTVQASSFREVDGGGVFVPGGKTLPSGSVWMQQPAVMSLDGAPTLPTITNGPYVLDEASAISIASAAAGTGAGRYAFSQTMLILDISARAYATRYRSTVTISVITGP